MERKRILIAVKDSQEIQDLRKSLISSGYEVKIVDNGVAALASCREFRPHLMLAENELPKIDGHHLLRELKSQSATRNIPFVLMSKHRSVEERVHSINMGVDDYISIPFDAEEVKIRFEIILSEIARFEATPPKLSKGFSGKLADINLIELLQILEIGKKSGIIEIQFDDMEGLVYMNEGEVYDAALESLESEKALFRMFTWNDGSFQVEMQKVEQAKAIKTSTQNLIQRGLIMRDRWERLTRVLPPMQATIKRVQKIPSGHFSTDEKSLLDLVKNDIRILDLIERSPLDDLKTLTLVVKLFKVGALEEVAVEEVEKQTESIVLTNQNKNGDSQISRMLVNFFTGNSENDKIERRRGDRRRIERRNRNRRWSDSMSAENQIYLNKSELLMIRENLLNGKKASSDHLGILN